MEKVNLIGQTFGRWVVLSKAPSAKDYLHRWLCRCKCGIEKIVIGHTLLSGKSRGCQYCMTHGAPVDLTGRIFGKWTVLKRASAMRGSKKHRWLCKCECGKEKIVLGGTLLSGTSHGCLSCRAQCRKGKSNPNWKRGKWYSKGGYVYVSSELGGRRVPEHVLVMERHLGRELLFKETIHHRNGIRDDNRLENLELWASNHPPGQRAVDLVVWAKEILEKYGPRKCE